ncbi:hypothetical protein V5J73_06965 [Flavobacterium sp. KS-LB2]|uniref:hypothetical protein n=1 Tax=Flavobacterium sp. KS-LB2 TaxID=3120525 RepID=UPI0030D336A3
MTKKGGDFEILAIDFLEKIFVELSYTVTRKRIQNSGSQDGYDNLVEIVDSKYKSYYIYSECKDCTGKTSQIDHAIPVQIDHQFRSKLTTTFQFKLTT